MNILIWFLIVSGALIIFMISYKYYEIKTGKFFIPKSFRLKVNNFFLKIGIILKEKIYNLYKFIKSKTDFIPNKFYIFLQNTWNKISLNVNRRLNKLRNRRYLDKN